MKRTRLRKKSKSEITVIQKELHDICKQIQLKKYGNICYTCGANRLEKQNCQLGHFIPNSICGALLRWDLRNLRIQCFRCNITLSGNGTEFYRRMQVEVGSTAVNELFIDKQRTVKALDHYRKTLDFYRENYADLIK